VNAVQDVKVARAVTGVQALAAGAREDAVQDVPTIAADVVAVVAGLLVLVPVQQLVRRHVIALVRINVLERLQHKIEEEIRMNHKEVEKCQVRIPVKVDSALASETERAFRMHEMMRSNFTELVRSGVPVEELAAYEERMLEVFKRRQECYDLIKGYAPEELKGRTINWEFVDFQGGVIEYWAV